MRQKRSRCSPRPAPQVCQSESESRRGLRPSGPAQFQGRSGGRTSPPPTNGWNFGSLRLYDLRGEEKGPSCTSSGAFSCLASGLCKEGWRPGLSPSFLSSGSLLQLALSEKLNSTPIWPLASTSEDLETWPLQPSRAGCPGQCSQNHKRVTGEGSRWHPGAQGQPEVWEGPFPNCGLWGSSLSWEAIPEVSSRISELNVTYLFKEYLRNTNQTLVPEMPFGYQIFPRSQESLRNQGQPRKPSQSHWSSLFKGWFQIPWRGGWYQSLLVSGEFHGSFGVQYLGVQYLGVQYLGTCLPGSRSGDSFLSQGCYPEQNSLKFAVLARS